MWKNLHVGVEESSAEVRETFKHFYHVFKIKEGFKKQQEV